MNKKIINALNWVGAIGAVITAVAYIIFIIVLIVGIEAKMEQDQLLLVSVVGAVAGLAITWMLRGQGVVLASNEEESKIVMDEYYHMINKDKPTKNLHTIKWHVMISSIKDILIKGITIGATTYYSVVIFMEGNGDFSLIGLAIVNVLMFLSFGILALSKAYKHYLDEHLSAIREITKRLKESHGIVDADKTDQVGSIPLEGVINEQVQQH